jgi:hypothetical protein
MHTILMGEAIERPRNRGDVNIKMDLRKTDCEYGR